MKGDARVRSWLLAVLLFSLWVRAKGETAPPSRSDATGFLKLSAFNIQIFGVTKFSDPQEVEILSRIVRRYDITLIQEIRDISQTVIYDFLDRVNSDSEDGPVYNVSVSARLGRTNNKEQYAYLYRTDRVELTRPLLYDDTDDVFEREPYSILVTSLLIDLPPFFLLGLHTDPDEVMAELNRVDEAFTESAAFYGTGGEGGGGGIILGDLNADCGSLSMARYDDLDLMAEGAGFTWLIGRDVDTTTSTSDCAYDTFIVSGRIYDFIVPGSAQPFLYDVAYNLTQELTLGVSDHYPIECLIQGSLLSSMATTTTPAEGTIITDSGSMPLFHSPLLVSTSLVITTVLRWSIN